MKKYLTGIIAVIMAIGFSAFTVNDSKSTNLFDPVYDWHQYDPTGTSETVPTVSFLGTELQARTTFNCPTGTPLICARAYDMDNNPLAIFIRRDK